MKSPLEIADAVELRAWAADEPFSISSLKEELDTLLPGDNTAEQAEELANQVFEELELRKRFLLAYPFEVDGNIIVPNDRKSDSSYLFCLGLVLLTDIDDDMRTREFETIVRSATEIYFRGRGVRVGAPWRTDEIQTYDQLLGMVCDLIPDLGSPIRTVAPNGGDGGWDVVVVNNFADRTSPRMIVLGNCATGRTDWLKKGQETAPAYFWSFFDKSPSERNLCITLLAVPFQMTDDDKTRKSYANSISFDRPRICELEPLAGPAAMKWLDGSRQPALDIALW